MKLLRPESVEEIEPAEYAENTEKSGNTIRVSEISIFTLEVEKLMRLLIQKILLLTKNSLLQKKQAVTVKDEAAKASKTDTNLEKFNCDQCNCTNSPEKGLTNHMQMKLCHKVDFRCLTQDHVDLCYEVIAVGI